MSQNTKGRLLKFLRECSDLDDRAALANLRCALRDKLKHRAWPILARFGGIGDYAKEYDHHAKVVQTVAGLFAMHPKGDSNGDFGLACRNLMRDDEKLYDPKDVGPVGRRFQHLLSSKTEEVCDRAIRLALRMKAQDVPVNYDELFDGLLFWGDKIKAKWAGSFWSAPKMEEVAE
ncbi:MAG: type I-E CRISPR-associated protein Cse2/CasB [Candidatus Omnitrophota bacterium]|nr:type I-E CRISPR-associated protein Cse2/CasB [Candidatus Omnitrophota bacterium]